MQILRRSPTPEEIPQDPQGDEVGFKQVKSTKHDKADKKKHQQHEHQPSKAHDKSHSSDSKSSDVEVEAIVKTVHVQAAKPPKQQDSGKQQDSSKPLKPHVDNQHEIDRLHAEIAEYKSTQKLLVGCERDCLFDRT